MVFAALFTLMLFAVCVAVQAAVFAGRMYSMIKKLTARMDAQDSRHDCDWTNLQEQVSKLAAKQTSDYRAIVAQIENDNLWS